MFLLDTNVLSAIRKRDPVALQWLVRVERRTSWISVLTIGEIVRGVSMKRRRDPIAAEHLARWLEVIKTTYADRIVAIDGQIAIEWGKLSAKQTVGNIDLLLAATALVHGMTVVTRNVADFADTGVPLLNPWEP